MGKISIWPKWLVLVAVLGALCLPAAWAEETKDQTIGRIIQAMEASGAKPTEIEVRTSIDLGFVRTTKDLFTLANDWSERLDLPSQANVFPEEDHVVYETQAQKGQTSIFFRMIGVPQDKAFHTYLVLRLKGNRIHSQDVEKWRGQVTALFKKASRIPQFSTCIRGIYSDKLSVDQQGDKVRTVLSALEASEIERLQDETVLSISAHTELWKPYITTGQSKMNVQVATHLDTLHSITRITIGTPIITAEY